MAIVIVVKVSLKLVNILIFIRLFRSTFKKLDLVLKDMKFYMSGVFVCAIGAFGLVGNFLSFMTLRSMSRNITLFHKLLLTLALVDTLFIIAGGAFMTRSAFG